MNSYKYSVNFVNLTHTLHKVSPDQTTPHTVLEVRFDLQVIFFGKKKCTDEPNGLFLPSDINKLTN